MKPLLTDLAVRNARAGRRCDGGGLYLVVKDSGARSWQFWFKRGGRRREMGLGGYPTVKLTEARKKAVEARAIVLKGGDPIQAAKMDRPVFGATFDAFARECLTEWTTGRGWKPKTEAGWKRSLLTYSARLGPLSVNDVNTEAVLAVLKPMWAAHPESAKKTRQRLEEVLDAAKVRGLRDGDNPARWSGHLEHYLSAPRKLVRDHRPPWHALSVSEVRDITGASRWALAVARMEGKGGWPVFARGTFKGNVSYYVAGFVLEDGQPFWELCRAFMARHGLLAGNADQRATWAALEAWEGLGVWEHHHRPRRPVVDQVRPLFETVEAQHAA